MSAAIRSAIVADYMTRPVSTITPGTGLKAVAARLRAQGFSGMPVIDGSGRPVGVLSEADLLVRAERPAVRREGVLACQVMSRPAVTIRADAPITQAAHLLHSYGLKRLLVVDGAGRLEGVVSRGDLLQVFLRSDSDIRRDLVAALGPELRGVAVTVEDGIVALRGPDVNGERFHRLSYLAERVDGVVGVRCLFADEPGAPPRQGEH
jgi:CBS domain-containing protein